LGTKHLFTNDSGPVQFNTAVGLQNRTTALHLAHSLKFSCTTLGATELARQAQLLEHALQDQAAQALAELKVTVLQELRSMVDDLATLTEPAQAAQGRQSCPKHQVNS
jgi:HPt (histidine-containing phosphotransfer) domain-containing protein